MPCHVIWGGCLLGVMGEGGRAAVLICRQRAIYLMKSHITSHRSTAQQARPTTSSVGDSSAWLFHVAQKGGLQIDPERDAGRIELRRFNGLIYTIHLPLPLPLPPPPLVPLTPAHSPSSSRPHPRTSRPSRRPRRRASASPSPRPAARA